MPAVEPLIKRLGVTRPQTFLDPLGVESVARHLPEISMPSLRGAQPGILQLFVSPEFRKPLDVIAQCIAALFGSGPKVEERAIGVENAGAHPAK